MHSIGPIVIASASSDLRSRWLEALGDVADTPQVDSLDRLEQTIRMYQPASIVLDLELSKGADGLARLHGAHPQLRIMAITRTHTIDEAAQAIIAGAHGHLHRETDARTIRHAVELMCRDGLWAERRVLEAIIKRLVAQEHTPPGPGPTNNGALNALSERECEIAHLVGEGLCYKSIAKRLGISENTVRNHLRNAYRKLGVNGMLQLGLLVKEATSN